jgi:hypothetical protein
VDGLENSSVLTWPMLAGLHLRQTSSLSVLSFVLWVNGNDNFGDGFFLVLVYCLFLLISCLPCVIALCWVRPSQT